MQREYYRTRQLQVSAIVSGSEVGSIRRKDVVKTGLRIFEDGVIGTAGAIGSFDPAGLEGRARDALGCGIEYPWGLSTTVGSVEHLIGGFSPGDLAAEAEAVMEAVRRSHPGFVFSGSISYDDITTSMDNDAGLDLRSRTSGVSIGLEFREKGSPGIMDGWVGMGPCRRWDRKAALAEMDEFLNAYGNRIDLPSEGLQPVIFGWEARWPIFTKLAGDLHGLEYGTGASLLAGRIGERIFSESFDFNFSIDPLIEDIPHFDTEGVPNPAPGVPLIESGVLARVCTDRRVSTRYGLEHTGCAGGSYDGIPTCSSGIGRPISSGRTLADLVEGRPSVFVAVSMGGDFTPDGSFATPVQLAMLHDGRRFVGRLPELNVSSHLFRIFGEDWVGVSADGTSSLAWSPSVVTRLEVLRAGA